jgi:hypothetical protein
MLQRVRENIRVGVIHGPGARVNPIWFDWRRQKHTIKEVTYHWRNMLGDAPLLHYSVTDGTALYELIYDVSRQIWTLESVDAD